MYIFELIYKIFYNLFHKKEKKQPVQEIDNNTDFQECEHIFLPVDSTKRVLACTKCGILIRAENLKKHQKKKKILPDNSKQNVKRNKILKKK